jgi:ribonuclease P protein component
MGGRRDYRFPRKLRVVHARQFDAVFKGRVRATAGPLVVWAAPNELEHSRLGLAISRRAGRAAVRNRMRRLIRESFRLMRDDLPRGYDLVVSARRHEPLTLDEYRAALARAVETLERRWNERSTKPNGQASRHDP